MAGDDRSVKRHASTGALISGGTAWIPEGDLAIAQWLDYGRRLGAMGRGVAWWIGDWLLYGNEHYGEKYVRAARVTGYDVQSLMNMAYVASRFSRDRRRGELSWSHHSELAALPPGEQDRWLDLAAAQRLSVRSLRLELRTSRRIARRRSAAAGHDQPDRGDAHRPGDGPHRSSDLVCPHCRHIIEMPRSRRRLGRVDVET